MMNYPEVDKGPLFNPGMTMTKIGLVLLFVLVCLMALLTSPFGYKDEETGNDLL